MIALNLDHTVLGRAAGAAQFLQSARQLREPRSIQGQPADHRYALARAPGDLPSYAYARLTVARARARIKSAGRSRHGPRRVPQQDAAEGVFGLHA